MGKLLEHVFVLDPETNRFLRDEFNVDPLDESIKFTVTPLEGTFHKPVYETEHDKPTGFVGGGDWVDADPLPVETELGRTQRQLNQLVNAERARLIRQPVPFLVDTQDEFIQVSSETDISNISGMVQQAVLMKMVGDTSASLKFRFLSNREHFLTPDQMIGLGQAASLARQQAYQWSWDLKDTVNGAQSLEELEAIPEVEGLFPHEG